jgi:selenocysteine lyase/cysteine desulfurase
MASNMHQVQSMSIYLNNAAMARFLPDVQQAGVRAISDQMSYTHEQEAETVSTIRRHFATLLNAPGDEGNVAIVPSTGFAITMAARNIETQFRDQSISSGRILVLEDQMCSAVYPWQDLCDRSKGQFKLEIVPFPDRTTSWTEQILQRLQAEIGVVLVCLPPLHWSDGALIDLVAIGYACRANNIPLIVDATQAVGAMPLSVRQIQPALLACSIHKWLRGPAGACLVYIDPSLHDSWSPLDQHGRGRDLGSDNWNASKDEMGPDGYPEKFFDDARKFDSGGRPNPIILPMLRASLDHVVSLDCSQTQAQLKGILQPFLDWVKSTEKFVLPAEHPYHLLGIRPSANNPMTPDAMIEISSRLQKEKGIYIAIRCGAFRISPYIDNNADDIISLVEALEEMT